MSTPFTITISGTATDIQGMYSTAEEVARALLRRGCTVTTAEVMHGEPYNRQRTAVAVADILRRRTADVLEEAAEVQRRVASERVRAKRPKREEG